MEALESALRFGGGRVDVHVLPEDPVDDAKPKLGSYPLFVSATTCTARIATSTTRSRIRSTFSFNSPLGACDTCRGFGRVIGIDFGLIIPDENKTLREGAVKPWQTKSFSECQREMEKYAPKFGIPLDVPFKLLEPQHRQWVLKGQDAWTGSGRHSGTASGIFSPGSKARRTRCTSACSCRSTARTRRARCARAVVSSRTCCCGAWASARTRIPPWRRNGSGHYRRFQAGACGRAKRSSRAMPGLSIHDLMLLPLARVRLFFDRLEFVGVLDEATELLLEEVRARLRFLNDVGLGYLTLDRQSRTLSGARCSGST